MNERECMNGMDTYYECVALRSFFRCAVVIQQCLGYFYCAGPRTAWFYFYRYRT